MIYITPVSDTAGFAEDIAPIYGKMCPLGFNDLECDEWIEMAAEGEILMYQHEGLAIGAAILASISEHRSVIHLVRWAHCPWDEWVAGSKAVCRWFFLAYPEVRRIDAFIPIANPAAVKIADAVGFRQIGVVPDEMFCEGKYHDVMFWTLHRDWLEV